MGSVKTKSEIDRQIIMLTERMNACKSQRLFAKQNGNQSFVDQMDRTILDYKRQIQELRLKRSQAPD